MISNVFFKNLTTWFWLFIAIFCISETPLKGGWSQPPEIIYPSSFPFNASNPSIATDRNSNSIAVWIDNTGSGSLLAATLASGAVNGLGQPAWTLINPISTSSVTDPTNSYAQSVAVDGSGNAMAAWTDGAFTYVSTLPFGQTSWSPPTTIGSTSLPETIQNVYIAVALNGNAIVTWGSSNNPYDYHVFANVYDSNSHTWIGQTLLIGPGVIEEGPDDSINQVSIDPNGNGIVVFTNTTNNQQAASYNVNANTWTLIPATDTNIHTHTTYGCIDSSGNGTIMWIDEANIVSGSTLPFNQTTLTNVTQLSLSSTPDASPPIVVADAAGNVVAVWPDSSGALGSARYSFATSTWNVLPLLNLGGNIPYLISLSGDSQGNVIASWTVLNNTNGYIQSASLAVNQTSWGVISQVSPSSGFAEASQISLTPAGDAVMLWNNISSIQAPTPTFGGTINSSIFLNVFFLSLQPSFFNGQVLKNKFLTATDRIHQLTWGASPNPSIVQYRLYRNGKLINTQAASRKPIYSYQDHDRSKRVNDVYKLIAISSNGHESTPLYVSLK